MCDSIGHLTYLFHLPVCVCAAVVCDANMLARLIPQVAALPTLRTVICLDDLPASLENSASEQGVVYAPSFVELPDASDSNGRVVSLDGLCRYVAASGGPRSLPSFPLPSGVSEDMKIAPVKLIYKGMELVHVYEGWWRGVLSSS